MKLEKMSPEAKAKTFIVLYAKRDQRVAASSIECNLEPCPSCEFYRGRYKYRSNGEVEIFCSRRDFPESQTT